MKRAGVAARGGPWAAVAFAMATLACASASRDAGTERHPTDTRPRTEGGPTVVGTVTPEGTVVADTFAGMVPDTERVDRETVVTGAVAREPGVADAPEPGVADAWELRAAGDTPAAAPPIEAPAGPWTVQVYAASERASAAAMAREAEAMAGVPARVEREAEWYKVRVGAFADRAAAEALCARLAVRWRDAFLVRAAGS